MKQAKDYIIFPLDVASSDEAKKYVDWLAEDVGMFKVGLELFVSSGPEIIQFIHSAGAARVFLDLKLHDIPATVARAMERIANFGVAFATVHIGETKRMLEAAVEGSGGKVEVLGVTVLTSVSAKDLKAAGFRDEICSDLSNVVMQRAQTARDAGCAGVICSGREAAKIKKKFGTDLTVVTPGIRPRWAITAKDDQERITTPTQAITYGADYLVIGRPIRDAKKPRQAANRVAEEIEEALQKK
jgi:orotidine-5'-phosphate decarboxylase